MEDFNNELSMLVKELEVKGTVIFVQGATEGQISEFENKNKIGLPAKYKEWLLFSDGGELFPPAGIQLYGVAHSPIIDVEDNDKPNDNYIVIGAFADGRPILCEKNNEHILIYDHEIGEIEKDDIFDNFFDFLNKIDIKLD
jgi:hypothetical protein